MARFTPANARHFGALGNIAIRSRAAERARLAALPPAEPDQDADYEAKQIAIVREHIAMVDHRLAKAADPRAIECLARARGSLSEQERICRGKPLPGAYRPDKQRVAKPPSVEPL